MCSIAVDYASDIRNSLTKAQSPLVAALHGNPKQVVDGLLHSISSPLIDHLQALLDVDYILEVLLTPEASPEQSTARGLGAPIGDLVDMALCSHISPAMVAKATTAASALC